MHIDNYLFLSSLLSLVSATPTPSLHRRASPPQSLPCDYKFFTQSIDHFGKHDGTFQQRYSIVEDFFKPGGPILFYQAEEITYPECAVCLLLPLSLYSYDRINKRRTILSSMIGPKKSTVWSFPSNTVISALANPSAMHQAPSKT